ncbi:MAG: hypothetical protein ABI165_10065 [Bryobacteraceae bacterium]
MVAVFDWLRNRRAKPPDPLSGAPPRRRLKTFSAASGYVFQYFYEGRRACANGLEYIFSFSADGKSWNHASVILDEGVLPPDLRANQRYAVAKMSLFRAFDEHDGPQAALLEIRPAAADVVAILEELDLADGSGSPPPPVQ